MHRSHYEGEDDKKKVFFFAASMHTLSGRAEEPPPASLPPSPTFDTRRTTPNMNMQKISPSLSLARAQNPCTPMLHLGSPCSPWQAKATPSAQSRTPSPSVGPVGLKDGLRHNPSFYAPIGNHGAAASLAGGGGGGSGPPVPGGGGGGGSSGSGGGAGGAGGAGGSSTNPGGAGGPGAGASREQPLRRASVGSLAPGPQPSGFFGLGSLKGRPASKGPGSVASSAYGRKSPLASLAGVGRTTPSNTKPAREPKPPTLQKRSFAVPLKPKGFFFPCDWSF